MSWENNPVSSPEKYGFEYVGYIELDNEPWQFYELAVLKNDKGYYLTTDSGCSCPMPFESHTVDDLTGPLTAEQAREEVESLVHLAAMSDYSHPDDPSDLLASIV